MPSPCAHKHSMDENGYTRINRGSKRRVSVAPTATPFEIASDVRNASPVRNEFVPIALFAVALIGSVWALRAAPHTSWGLAILLGTTVLLDVLAGDVLRAGRRIIAPGLVLCVAAFILYGTPGAVLVGLARGVVRVLVPRPLPFNDASCIVATAVLGPLLGGLSATALHSVAHQPWVAPAVYVGAAYTIEAGAAMLLLARVSRPSLRLSFEQTFGWTMLHFAVLGALGAWLGNDLIAGRWLSLAYFVVPIAVIRHGFDVFHARAERYVAALELENTQLFDKIGQLDRITGDLAETLGMAIDCRDGIDQDHSHRVARLASSIGAHLGMSGADIEVLRRGALLHDVGTLAIPAEIFSKPGPLTPNERRRMQLHTEFGSRLVGKWRDCRTLAEIIEQHHERLDGSGYPRGLKGDQIIFEARIVGAAEAYVALTSDRPWRAAYPSDEALRILKEHTPAEYDPLIVEALASVAALKLGSVVPLPLRQNG
jgi:putative nucleotidyltransferase with HDIG domain